MGGKKKPGLEWRLLAHEYGKPVELENRGVFDELCVDDWLHIEQMDHRVWWMRVGDARIWVSIAKIGVARVDVERGCYEDIVGDTTVAEYLNASSTSK